MDMPDKKTGAVVSALMVVAALAGVAVGLLWGNFGIKPPGEANALDDDAVVPGEALLPPDEVPPDVAARLAGLTRTRLTLIRSAIEDYALGNAGKPPATLRDLVEEGILGAKTLRDAWGRPIRYAPEGTAYDLRSLGPDGVPSADDLTE